LHLLRLIVPSQARGSGSPDAETSEFASADGRGRVMRSGGNLLALKENIQVHPRSGQDLLPGMVSAAPDLR